MNTRTSLVFAITTALAGCTADRPPAPPPAAPRTVALTAATPRSLPGRAVGSRDERGVPRLVWDSSGTAYPKLDTEEAARAHLARHAAVYGVTAEALATLRPIRTVRTSAGVTVTTLRQFVGGDAVIGSDTSVLQRADGTLTAIMGAPHAAARAGLRSDFLLDAGRAVGAAVAAVTGDPGTARDLGDRAGGWRGFELAHPSVRAVAPVRARRVLLADGDQLRAAYEIELVLAPAGSTSSRAYRRFVAAGDGRILRGEELTASEAFSYQVWADADKEPLDGPADDFSPEPSGAPDSSKPDFTAQSIVSIEGFNSAPGGGADPWLPAGADVTTGNNADAYTDRFDPDGFTLGEDFRADITMTGQFHHLYDTGLSALASTTQTKAAIVQAFYSINWMHDYWYDSGFDEKGGNAQTDNFERGGEEGDPMHVEVQDNADIEIDNANMSTPADGMSPTMQIYVWTAAENRFVTLTPGGDQLAGNALFGPQTFDTTGTVALVADGTAPTTDACQNITNGASLAGKVVLIDRGNCDFIDKARAAQGKGAIGVLIANNVDSSSPISMGATRGGQPVTIPALSITKATGDALKIQLGAATVTARMFRAAGPLRDGSLDATVITHEWGHYLHHRLIAGCGNLQCDALSEGWGDFVALHRMIHDGDAAGGTYTVGGYAGGTDPNSYYHGIRRTPYTTDFAKNPITFKNIGDDQPLPAGPPYNIFSNQNSEVHNAGEIWAEMMFEAYVGLLENRGGRSFDEVRRAMADYVVAGLALTPSDATYTEQRDAILAAAAATNLSDFTHMAEGFAVRGAGTCATSPARTSTTLNGVVESYELKAAPAIGAVGLDDGLRSCDEDGLLDAQERGHVFVEVLNIGAVALDSATVKVASSTTGVTFPAGDTATVGPIAVHGNATAEIVVALGAGFPDQGSVSLDVTVTGAGGCVAMLQTSVTVAANRDEVPSSSTTDTVESDATDFTPTGALGPEVWSRLALSPSQHLWHGIDLGSGSDTQLESPDLVVGAGALSMSFQHHYSFEASMGKNWDGGVIEISQDGGGSWQDASMFGAIPYTGTINNTAGNPLGGRQGFTKSSASYPSQRDVTVNLGTSLAGKTIRVRFRLGTDEAVGGDGWFIDNIGFTGLTNTPFHSVVDDATVCLAPTAGAGADQTVFTSSTVTLDGSASALGNGSGTLTYAWSQTSGPMVTLSSTTAAKPTFTAPAVPAVLVFELIVSDGVTASTADSVMITVVAGPDAGAIDAATPDAPTTPAIDAATPAADAKTTPAIDAATPTADAKTTPAIDAATPTADATTTPGIDAATSTADARITPTVDAATPPGADATTTPTVDAAPSAADASGGTADARATDAKVVGSPDAASVSAVTEGGGCSCTTGSRPPSAPAGIFMLLLALWRVRAPRRKR